MSQVAVIFRLSTIAEISKEASHEVGLIEYLRSTFDHLEGPTHHWINTCDISKEFLNKDGAYLFVAGVFLDDPPGSQGDRVDMIEKVKFIQQRYPWLHVLGFQPCSSTCSEAVHDRLFNVIMEEYINFPILLCSKIFPELVAGPCCMLWKGLKDPPLYHERDIDVSILCEGFEDGDFETAKLMRPAASYYHAAEDCLYIADSENHAIRRADIGRRVLETSYPIFNDKGKTGLWAWFLGKLGLKRDVVKSFEFDSESLLFPWHLLKSTDDDLLIMNKSFKTLWTMDMGSGKIHNTVQGHDGIMELCGQQIMEKFSHLKDISCDFLQRIVSSSNPLDGIANSGFLSSFVASSNHLLICDTVAQRVLMMNKEADSSSSIDFSNFRILALPFWLSFPLERSLSTDVYEEARLDHLQSFTLLPGKIDVHFTIDIPGNMELVEPLEELCVWRQVRGAAVEVLGMNGNAATTDKVGVAQQWYDELDNLAFEEEPEVCLEEKKTPQRDLEDGKIHINCVVNTSPGTSEVIILAPLYLKLRNSLQTCKDTQEKAAAIADILKPDNLGMTKRDAFIRSLLNLNRDLDELVFVKPLRVKIRFEIINPPKTDNTRDIILTDSAVDVKVSLNQCINNNNFFYR